MEERCYRWDRAQVGEMGEAIGMENGGGQKDKRKFWNGIFAGLQRGAAICSVSGTAGLQNLQELQMSELCREKKCRITV